MTSLSAVRLLKIGRICNSSQIKKLGVALSLFTAVIILHVVYFSDSLSQNFIKKIDSNVLPVNRTKRQALLPRLFLGNATSSGGSDVLIVGYMRTGSSFMGKVLGFRDDVFYWMEPLRKGHDWQYYRGQDLLCEYLSPTCNIVPEKSALSSSNALDLLRDIFSCNIQKHTDIPTDISLDEYGLAPSWASYNACIKTRGTGCMRVLEKACRSAKHRVLKVVRIDLQRASDLLKMNPRLKIVMIFRDPRGSFNSHLMTKWYSDMIKTVSQQELDIQVLCSRILNDINTGKRLTTLYPERVKLVQYEDLSDVRQQITILYRFLEFKVSAKFDKFIEDMFQSPANGGIGGFHPFAYRHSLSWSYVEMVNKYCQSVYRELGLREFKTYQEYTNTSISPIIDTLPYPVG